MPTSDGSPPPPSRPPNYSVGNDIVDLAAREPALHPRFRARVFTADEQQRIGDDQALLWCYWAAKEAAYKTLKRIEPALVFAPRTLEFDHASSTVACEGWRLPCRHSLNEKWAMALCTHNPSVASPFSPVRLWTEALTTLEEVAQRPLSPSEAVRLLARRECAQLLQLSPESLTIGSLPASPKIPCLLREDQQLPHPLSFSHHGRFVSCAVLWLDSL